MNPFIPSSILQLLQINQDVQEASKTFMNESATKDEVKIAGCLVFVLLYGGRISDTLSDLRCINYKKLAATTKKLLPETLPPSEAAAKYYCLRVHLQVK